MNQPTIVHEFFFICACACVWKKLGSFASKIRALDFWRESVHTKIRLLVYSDHYFYENKFGGNAIPKPDYWDRLDTKIQQIIIEIVSEKGENEETMHILEKNHGFSHEDASILVPWISQTSMVTFFPF